MIEVEGYKAFHGMLRITPAAFSGIKPFEIEADWLYKPEYGCWYGDGRSYPEEICTPIDTTGEEKLLAMGYALETESDDFKSYKKQLDGLSSWRITIWKDTKTVNMECVTDTGSYGASVHLYGYPLDCMEAACQVAREAWK